MKTAIIAPAGVVDGYKLQKGLEFLKAAGYEVTAMGGTLEKAEHWTAGSAIERATEFQEMWLSDGIDLVWAARGGFGCIHMLEYLDWGLLREKSKILCGHSDLTILHLAFLKMGVTRSVSACMPAVEMADGMDDISIKFLDLAIRGQVTLTSPMGRVVKRGSCQGKLIPVTLSVLCSLLGTEWLPDFAGAVLVLEDVNEAPYRLDAYLSQLKLAGVLECLGGLVFGDFSHCGEEHEQDYLISKFAPFVSGPVVSHVAFGHCMPRVSLPCGVEVEMIVEEGFTIRSL